MEKANFSSFFEPKSVAVVGASEKPGKIGTAIAENVLKLGFAGEIFLVNPSYTELFKQKCYQNLDEIESQVDLAVVVVPAKFVLDVVKNSAKVKNFVIISAGFAETGKEGAQLEKELADLAREKGLNILGPNCLGFLNPSLKLNASFAVGMPEDGSIALGSQSGALLVAILDVAKKENLSFSLLVSLGNKMQLSETEILEQLEKDQKTKVIGMYLEGIKNGAQFIETAERVARQKPIVILKAGKTAKAQQAISSHTGALAGSDEIVEAVFEKVGVVRTETLEDFLQTLKIFSAAREFSNEKVAVITNAGGGGVLATDAFKGKTIQLADFSDEFKFQLQKELPAEGSVNNPIDILGDADEKRYAWALENLEKEELGAIIAILTPQEKTPVGAVADLLIDFKKRSSKNVAAAFVGGQLVEEARAKMQKNGILVFDFPEKAVEILNRFYVWQQRKNLTIENGESLAESQTENQKMAGEILEKAQKSGRKALDFLEAAKVMELYGIKTVQSFHLSGTDQIPQEIEYPVVAKIDSDQVLHKTDQKALVLNIKNADELKAALADFQTRFNGEKVLVQSMLSRGMELILGINRDPIFGPIVVAGLGGIYTEVFKMVDFFVAPLNLVEIEEKLKKGKTSFLFRQTRGQKEFDVKELALIIQGLMNMAQDLPQIAELDINPLFVYNDGQAAVAVDVKIIF